VISSSGFLRHDKDFDARRIQMGISSAFSMARRFGIALPFVFFVGQRAQPQQVCAPPSTLERPNVFFKGMVAWWPATGSSTCLQAGCFGYNEIIGGNNGTPMGGVTFAAGEVGPAFSFNGSGSVQVPVPDSNSLLLGSGEMTLDAWINTSTIPSGGLEGPIVGKFNPAYPYQGYGLWVNGDGSGTAMFTAADCTTPPCGWLSSEFPVVSTSSVTNGHWHHVAGVRRNPGTYEIWVDGQMENSVAQSMWNTDSSNALYMGQLDGISGYWYTGLVDEVEVFNRALTPSEIKAIYNAGSAGLCPQARFGRPTLMGVSVGNTTGTPSPCSKTTPCASGTAGLLVYSTSNPSQTFILGSNHVLSAVGPTFCPGTAQPGTWTLQPGTGDLGIDPGNIPHYHVASFTTGVTNSNIDAGLSQVVGPTTATTGIFGIGEPNPHVGVAYSGETVVKSGEGTGVTMGTVKSVNVTVPIPNTRCLSLNVFHNQISITPQGVGPFSAGGDSGSAILDAISMTPIGLLMAGTSTVTFANPINKVYVDLSVFPVSPSGAGLTWEQELGVVAQSVDPRLARLEEIQERHEDEVLRIPGVQGIGIGLDEKRENLLFHVYVIKQTPSLTGALPREIDGIPVQVIETGGEVTPL
jgi:hypothetical protein